MKNRHCINCGNPLDGKQVQYCSPKCANAGWQRDNAVDRAAYKRDRRASRKPATVEDRLRARVADLEAEVAALTAALNSSK